MSGKTLQGLVPPKCAPTWGMIRAEVKMGTFGRHEYLIGEQAIKLVIGLIVTGSITKAENFATMPARSAKAVMPVILGTMAAVYKNDPQLVGNG